MILTWLETCAPGTSPNESVRLLIKEIQPQRSLATMAEVTRLDQPLDTVPVPFPRLLLSLCVLLWGGFLLLQLLLLLFCDGHFR